MTGLIFTWWENVQSFVVTTKIFHSDMRFAGFCQNTSQNHFFRLAISFFMASLENFSWYIHTRNIIQFIYVEQLCIRFSTALHYPSITFFSFFNKTIIAINNYSLKLLYAVWDSIIISFIIGKPPSMNIHERILWSLKMLSAIISQALKPNKCIPKFLLLRSLCEVK